MDKDVYFSLPEGYKTEGKVGHLIKALWGLRQSPLLFWRFIRDKARGLGFQQADSDECFFIASHQQSAVMLVVYVDDFILCGEQSGVDHYFGLIADMIEISDRGYVRHGEQSNLSRVSTTRDKDGSIHIIQNGYIARMLEKYDPDNRLYGTNTPISKWSLEKCHEPVSDGDMIDRTKYLDAVGELLYLATASRPDVTLHR